MDGDLKMGGNKNLNIRSLEDYKVDDSYEVRERDLYSVFNKQYLNTKFLKVDKEDNFFDLNQKLVKNCEPYRPSLFGDHNSMSGTLNMNNQDIDRVKSIFLALVVD